MGTGYTYGPFGQTALTGTASANPFQFTGRENDGTGVYHYRARYYHPGLGRFISEDPVRFAGGINFYAYATNSPISLVDRLGLCPDISHPSNECLNALAVAHADRRALARAIDKWDVIQAAAAANGVDPRLLAAIGIRETGFRNIPEMGGGLGRGIFQIDVGQHPSVTEAQAYDVGYAANFAANLLATNMARLAAEHPNFTPRQLSQATAASYNFGTGNISGNPKTIDIGTTGNNYGSNVLHLISCFQ